MYRTLLLIRLGQGTKIEQFGEKNEQNQFVHLCIF